MGEGSDLLLRQVISYISRSNPPRVPWGWSASQKCVFCWTRSLCLLEQHTRPFLFPMHIGTPLLQSRLLHKSLNFFLSTGTGSGSGVPNVRMMTGPPCQTNNNNKCMYKYILNVEFYTIFMFMLFAHMHGQCFQIGNVQVQTPS